MNQLSDPSRRSVLKLLTSGAVIAPLAALPCYAEDALVKESDPAAQAVHYVEDVKRAKDAKPGSSCANCSLYSGDSKSTQASCALFGNKQVKAVGWCSAWTNM